MVDTDHEMCETLYPGDWATEREGVTGVGSGASNFLSYYPSPQAGKWVKIYNFKFTLLDLITTRVNQDNNAMHDTKVACSLTCTTKSIARQINASSDWLA